MFLDPGSHFKTPAFNRTLHRMNREPQPNPKVRLLTVSAEQAGQRVDNFLLRELKGVPRTRVYRLLRRGEVRVNKGRIGANYRLAEGDVVRIPPVRTAATVERPGPGQRALERVAEAVVHEDDSLLVLDKPSGMAVHGGSGVSWGVIEALRALRPEARFLELVHRLDRETSGLLLIAKRRSTLRSLHELMREGGVEKRYLALLQGRWKGGARRMDMPLLKNTLRGGERVVTVSAEGKPALSVFRPVDQYPGAVLVEVELHTGRTHQIRVHAAHAGHPIAGDPKYGDEAFNEEMKVRGLQRLFLHAHSLAFRLPDGRELDLSAPLPAELAATLERL